MIKEIGSEFHLNFNTTDKANNNINTIQKSCADYAYTRSGREAIGLVLDEIHPKTKIAVLPAYICKSVLQPFLSRGYFIEYISIDKNFNLNLDELKIALLKNPDIMLFIDWFGMNKNEKAVSMAREISNNLIIIADCTHNYFSKFPLVKADYIIASLRKWFALPDGAIALNCYSTFKNKPKFIENVFLNKRKEAMLLKREYLISNKENLKLQYRKLLAEAELYLDSINTVIGISPLSISLINQTDYSLLKQKRNINFNALNRLIPSYKSISIINTIISNNDCPLCFPILVEENRDELQKWLSDNKIYCSVLWELPEDIYSNFKTSAYIADNILCIPCDQRYSVDDMKYIVDVIKEFYKSN